MIAVLLGIGASAVSVLFGFVATFFFPGMDKVIYSAISEEILKGSGLFFVKNPKRDGFIIGLAFGVVELAITLMMGSFNQWRPLIALGHGVFTGLLGLSWGTKWRWVVWVVLVVVHVGWNVIA